MKLSKSDRIFKRKMLDAFDGEQLRLMEKWLDKTYAELNDTLKTGIGSLSVKEALVIRFLVEKINKGK